MCVFGRYEDQGKFSDAIKYFAMSSCYSHAIRLAREHGNKEDMLKFALQAGKGDMIEAAEYYESQVAPAVLFPLFILFLNLLPFFG